VVGKQREPVKPSRAAGAPRKYEQRLVALCLNELKPAKEELFHHAIQVQKNQQRNSTQKEIRAIDLCRITAEESNVEGVPRRQKEKNVL